MQPYCLHENLTNIGAVEVRSLQMEIKFDFSRRQQRCLIVSFQAEGQICMESQEATTTAGLLETIAHTTRATVDDIVTQGSMSVNITRVFGVSCGNSFPGKYIASTKNPH
ncbi:hypothetical protein MRX96_056764 [Rhipicephalus microplus]